MDQFQRQQLLELFDALATEADLRRTQMDKILEAVRQADAPVITSDIEPPPASNKRRPRRPVAELEIGETFFLPGRDARQLLSGDRIRQKHKMNGKEFTVRKGVEAGIFGARIWRTE